MQSLTEEREKPVTPLKDELDSTLLYTLEK
jgi:hypothetical protein